MDDVFLPARQEELLEALARFDEVPEQAARLDDFAAFEALRKRCLQVQAQRHCKQKDAQSSRLQWLQALHEAFGSTQEQQEKMVHALSQVEAEHRELDRKTTWLRGHCQETLKSSNGLALYAQQIAERLNTLCSFESIAQELDDSTLLSKPAQLERLLQRLEAAASFVESRYDFFDAKNCRSTCDHLRNRVCILMRSTLMHSLEVADSQVQDILWEQEEGTTSVDTQIFYTSFHMIAPTIKTFMSVLRKQAHLHQQYAATLDAAEAALADLRKRLPSSHWESLQEMNPDLLELVRPGPPFALSLK